MVLPGALWRTQLVGRLFTARRSLFVTGMDRIHLQEHSLLVHMMEGTPEIPGLRHIPGVNVYLDSADDVDRDLISAIGIEGLDFTQAVAEYYKRGVTVFDRVNTSLYSKRIVESMYNAGDLVGTTVIARRLGRMDMDVFNR